jgi:hypothetical protein
MAMSVLKQLGAAIMVLTMFQVVSESSCVQASPLSSRAMINDWNEVSSFSALDEFTHYLLLLSCKSSES